VRCSPDQVIVTSGAQQAFDIILRLLIDPGERVWMEEPGYLDVRGALVAAGARIVPVPVDDEGIDVAAGIRIARQARLAIVSPSHQYPTGTTLSVARRMALLSWATREGAWIIEDDYDSYFRYRGRPLSALQQLDLETAPAPDEGRVVYVGTFSKTMFPSLRLGFCIVPEWLAGHAANARAIADRNSPIADQAALATFIEEGHYDRHLRRVRVVCQERYDALRHHITRLLGDTLALNPSSAGTHVLAHLRNERAGRKRNAATTSAIAQLAAAAAAHDLVVFRLSRYCLETPVRDALVLGYGGLPLRRIQWGVEQLARAAQSCGLG
jgi:GntR family transcriptional regulator/MocR family aminotransferase